MSEEIESAVTRRHWSTKARLILAGVAVLGVGAAITTAAWTDNVFFSANATTASVDLEGRVLPTLSDPAYPGTDWAPGDSTATAIEIPVAFEGLYPGDTFSVELEIRNIGTGGWADLTATIDSLSGDLFNGDGTTATPPAGVTAPWDPALAVTITPSTAGPIEALAAAQTTATDTATFTLQVVTPSDWDEGYSGTSGTIVVLINGQAASAPTP